MMSSIVNRCTAIAVNARAFTNRCTSTATSSSSSSAPVKPGLKPSRRVFSFMAGGAFAAGGRSDAVARQAAGANPEIAKVLLDPKYPDVFPFGEQEMQR